MQNYWTNNFYIDNSINTNYNVTIYNLASHIWINRWINKCSPVQFCWHHFLELNFTYILILGSVMSLTPEPCNNVSGNLWRYQIIYQIILGQLYYWIWYFEYGVPQFDNEMSYDVTVAYDATVAGWWIAVEGRASS